MIKYTDTGKKDTRSGFGAGLYEAGKADSRVVALTADLKGSLKMDAFAEEFPERFIQCGIAEANMIGVAAGMAITGKIPFAGSFAEFVTGRVYDQIRQEIAYGETNVKIAASHAGITLGEDGATHQTMEDIALMRALPGMVVINPCDYNQTKAATIAAANYEGPVYLRFGRPAVPNFTPENQTFEIGKAYVLNEGILVFTCKELRDQMDIKIFVDADDDDRLMRVMARDIIERGKTVETVIERYTKTVKPMYLQFIEPSKRYADIIIPQGGHNKVAIDIISATIEKSLQKKNAYTGR